MRKKRNGEKPGKQISEQIADFFEMPRDVVLRQNKLTVIGTNQLNIENYTGVLEYTEEAIRVKTSEHLLAIEGKGLSIDTITDTDIYISGIISCVRWE